ncbi:MAG: hypothetical protein GU362_06770 [Thaumarchaeota archaeon]|jgi:hypothetical protein|nr:hypothetical protein [Nitrososphaerota archaeon]
MNLSADFIRGFSLRVTSYFLQIFFPVYLLYYIKAVGLVYWSLVIIFWVSAGIGVFLPYLVKEHGFYLEILFFVLSFLLFLISKSFSVLILIALAALVSALTGTYTYFSFARESYRGVLNYMRGQGAGLLLSATIAFLLFYFASLKIESFAGLLLMALALILIITTIKKGVEKHDVGSLSFSRLVEKAFSGLKSYYEVIGNALFWISFTTYIYYYLYVCTKASYELAILLILISSFSVFLTRMLLKENYSGRSSKTIFFVLYAVSFLIIAMNAVVKYVYVDFVSAILIGVSQGALSTDLLFESISFNTNGSYDGYIIYNAYIGAGELLSNVFFGLMVTFSMVKLFYMLVFIVAIIIIFLNIKHIM